MATIADTAKLKDNLIEAAAQSVLAPFNINNRFYNDIIKKVKTITQKFDKTKFSKNLQESITSSLTSFTSPLLPTTKLTPKKDKTKDSKESDKTDTNLFNALLDKLKRSSDTDKKDSYFETTQSVVLEEIAPKAFKEINQLLHAAFPEKKEKATTAEDKDKKSLKERFGEGGLLGLLPKSLLPILGGATLILGGLAALVGAFVTQGPAKGTLELIGKVGIKGGLALLAKNAFKTIGKGALKHIPIIGSLISFGFAIQRFMNRDIIGGALDLVSGLVSLLDFAIPGLGTVLSLGVDVLQAVLDAKAGGSSAEASAKKTGILLEWAKGLGGLIYKGLRYLPVIGPLFDVYDSYEKGDWAGVAVNLLRSVGQMSGVFYVIDLIDSLTGGNLRSMATEGMATMGDWLGKMGSWLYESAKEWPIIGRLIKIGEAIGANNWAEAITQFTRIIPGMGWLLDAMGWTEEKQTQAYQQSGDLLSNLWTWMRDTLWEKVTGFVSNLTDGIKSWWDNLSWDPRSWFGKAPEPPKLTEPSIETPIAPANKPVPMATGGIATTPTNAIIGEAGPEAVIPLNEYFDADSFSLNNDTLEQIAGHTGNTNTNIKNLTNAIFALASSIGKTQGSNTIPNIAVVNNQQQAQYPSASQVAASNVDAIRRVRQQFQFAT